MKNFNGTPLEINQIQGVDFLGYELIDKENGIRYELVNEPWVSLCAAAQSKARFVAQKDVEVAFVNSSWEQTPNVTNHLPNIRTMKIVNKWEDLFDYIYGIDYNGHKLTIHMEGLLAPTGSIVDPELNTNLLTLCREVQINFISKEIEYSLDFEYGFKTWDIGEMGEKNNSLTITGPIHVTIGGAIHFHFNQYQDFKYLIKVNNAHVTFNNFAVKINSGRLSMNPSYSEGYALVRIDNHSIVDLKKQFFIWFYRPEEGVSGHPLDYQVDFVILRIDNQSNVGVRGEARFTLTQSSVRPGTQPDWSLNNGVFYLAGLSIFEASTVFLGTNSSIMSMPTTVKAITAYENSVFSSGPVFTSYLEDNNLATNHAGTGAQIVLVKS